MDIQELYTSLKAAYTPDNLGVISRRIIGMFRENRYDALRYIQKVVHEYTPCSEEKINKVFSRLIMIYHPDRLLQAVDQLDEAFQKGDFEALYAMSHILMVQNLEPENVTVSSIITEEDLAEEFGWDSAPDGYSYFFPDEDIEDDPGMEPDYTAPGFLTALKRRIYGNLNVDIPIYLLEELDEIEMAGYEIAYLDGIEACRLVRVVDLSNNNLMDISDLHHLRQIERLYLSNNHISLIDSLSNLTVLQVLDISYNEVDDLSPLFELMHLSYLNVMGNRIPVWQLEKLHLQGVTIVE